MYQKQQGIHVFKFTCSLVTLIVFLNVLIYAEQFKAPELHEQVHENFLSQTESDGAALDASDIASIEFDDENPGVFTYIVQKGDNFSEIAQKFGTTVDTIKKVNNINGNALKRNQKLTITQTEGLLIELEKPTKAIVFANQYGLSLEDLMNLNYIQEPNQELLKGDEIFIPISEKQAIEKGLLGVVENDDPEPTKVVNTSKPNPTKVVATTKKPAAKIVTATSSRPVSSDQGGTDIAGGAGKGRVLAKRYQKYPDRNKFGFANGMCTDYASRHLFAGLSAAGFRGNAGQWCKSAEKAGYPVLQSPRAGTVVVFKNGYRGYSSYGHVGVVNEVQEDGIIVTDMNYAGLNILTKRFIPYKNSGILCYIAKK